MSLGPGNLIVVVPISQADGDVRYALSGTGGGTPSGTPNTYPVYGADGSLTNSRITRDSSGGFVASLTSGDVAAFPSIFSILTDGYPVVNGTHGGALYGIYYDVRPLIYASGEGATTITECDFNPVLTNEIYVITIQSGQQVTQTSPHWFGYYAIQNLQVVIDNGTYDYPFQAMNVMQLKLDQTNAVGTIDEVVQLHLKRHASSDDSLAGHIYSLLGDFDIKTSGQFYEDDLSLAEKYAPLVSGVNGTYTGTGITAITIVSGIITDITMGA